MKRIAYIAMGEAWLKKAHSIQTFHTCRYMAKENKVKVVYPLSPINYKDRKETKNFYKDSNMELRFIPKTFFAYFFTLLNFPGRYFFYILDRLAFSFFTFIHLLGSEVEIVFTKDPLIAFFFVVSKKIHRKKVIYEIHKIEHVHFEKANSFVRMLTERIEKKALRGSYALITITTWLKNYAKRFNQNVLFSPDGFDSETFKPKNKNTPRKKLKIPREYTILTYSGISFRHGVETLVQSMKNFGKEEKIRIYFVGGLPKQIMKLKRISNELGISERIIFVGNVAHKRVPDYLNASDLLILPYSKDRFTEYFSSPLKLFEYMAVGKPIIATKVGCFNGILKNGENAILVEPGNPKALAEGMKKLLKNRKLAKRIANNAYKDSDKYTYKKRAEKIMGLL